MRLDHMAIAEIAKCCRRQSVSTPSLFMGRMPRWAKVLETMIEPYSNWYDFVSFIAFAFTVPTSSLTIQVPFFEPIFVLTSLPRPTLALPVASPGIDPAHHPSPIAGSAVYSNVDHDAGSHHQAALDAAFAKGRRPSVRCGSPHEAGFAILATMDVTFSLAGVTRARKSQASCPSPTTMS